MTEFSETQLVSRKTVINTPCTLASYPPATLPPHLSSPSDPLHVPAHAQAGLEGGVFGRELALGEEETCVI